MTVGIFITDEGPELWSGLNHFPQTTELVGDRQDWSSWVRIPEMTVSPWGWPCVPVRPFVGLLPMGGSLWAPASGVCSQSRHRLPVGPAPTRFPAFYRLDLASVSGPPALVALGQENAGEGG